MNLSEIPTPRTNNHLGMIYREGTPLIETSRDLERRLTVAREALDKIAAPAAAGKFQQAIARKALSIIGQK